MTREKTAHKFVHCRGYTFETWGMELEPETIALHPYVTGVNRWISVFITPGMKHGDQTESADRDEFIAWCDDNRIPYELDDSYGSDVPAVIARPADETQRAHIRLRWNV